MMAERDPKTGRFPRGNGSGGAGWGGPEKGASTSRLKEKGDEYSDAVRALARDPKHEEAKAPLRELALKTWVEVCQDKAHPQRVVAADKIYERLDGKARQTTDITTGGERIGYVIPAPQEAPDAETWAEQYQPRH